jgi:heptosyltransferase-2
LKEFRRDSIRKILIRSTNWIGDAVMTTPAIRVIRDYFPNAEITILANSIVSQLFLFHPGIDARITFERHGIHRGIAGRVRLATELRKHSFDLAIIFPNSFDSALIPWLARIPEIIGKSSDGRTLMLSRTFGHSQEATSRHEVDYYLDLLQNFGITGNRTQPCLNATPAEMDRASAFLAECGIKPDDFILGINPGASFGSAKRWYPDRFAHVAQKLMDEWSAKVIIFGGPDETGIASDIEQRMNGAALNVAGKTSVRELMALIKRCNFFITNDSGPMHIAAAFDVPLVAIFGSTDHAGTRPYNNRSKVVRNFAIECAPCKLRECPTDHRCMTSVTEESVIDAALELADLERSDS